MNLADAIRRAALASGAQLGHPEPSFESLVSADAPEATTVWEEAEVTLAKEEKKLSNDIHSHDTSNVVRLELVLNPEQLKGFFGAVIGAQHSVLTLREAANYLRLTPGSLERMASDGEVPGMLVDGKWRFVRQALEDWLMSQHNRKEA